MICANPIRKGAPSITNTDTIRSTKCVDKASRTSIIIDNVIAPKTVMNASRNLIRLYLKIFLDYP